MIAVSIPKLSSKVAPVWAITADILPNAPEISADETLKAFETSLRFITVYIDKNYIAYCKHFLIISYKIRPYLHPKRGGALRQKMPTLLVFNIYYYFRWSVKFRLKKTLTCGLSNLYAFCYTLMIS